MAPLHRTLYAWLVHIFTASGATLGILSLYEVHKGNMILAFLYLAITIIIDAIDGTLARLVNIKKYSRLDGALLDNIIDFLTFVVVPCFIILTTTILSESWRLPCIIMISLASCYQFTQPDAKTEDHFFKGFPSYWSIVVFYLYYWQTEHTTNTIIIITCTLLTFIPIKYIYPSRMNHISKSLTIKKLMFIGTLAWGAATLGLLFTYPEKMPILNFISIAYIIIYFLFSIYRTFSPLKNN